MRSTCFPHLHVKSGASWKACGARSVGSERRGDGGREQEELCARSDVTQRGGRERRVGARKEGMDAHCSAEGYKAQGVPRLVLVGV